jgi:hypothetical protein
MNPLSYLEPIVILPVGYPLDQPDPSRHDEKRKGIQDIVSYEFL